MNMPNNTVGTASPPWFNPSPPSSTQCVTGALLDKAYRDCPERIFALFEDNTEISYAGLYHQTRQMAAALQKLGVKQGDRVLVWLPNGRPMLLAWFAINYMGATFVPINTSYRGPLLTHVITNAAATLMVAHTQLIPRLADIETTQLQTVVSIGDYASDPIGGLKILAETALKASEDELQPIAEVMPWDIHSIIYTSGTTGPSKGVLSTYCHHYTIATVGYGFMNSDDRMLVNMPLFHVSGTGAVFCALIRQSSIALFDAFDSKQLWNQIREKQATLVSAFVGSMAQFLEKAPPLPNDADNPLRMTLLVPISDTIISLSKRYDFDYVSGFGMSELPVVLVTEVNSRVPGNCGKPRSGVEVRLVDENDNEVAPGEVGELIARSDVPWSITPGYNAMPQASLEAWRNGWFHTGDLFRQDANGNYFYIDRRKDSIRRRGENISSQEVENVVLTYPEINDAAAVAVPSEESEDEVLLVITNNPGEQVDPLALFEFLRPRLAHFMLPRYIRTVDALPLTPTNKVQKNILRDEGVTADTWDREKAGVVVKREKLTGKA